jgi:hypothetical protein
MPSRLKPLLRLPPRLLKKRSNSSCANKKRGFGPVFYCLPFPKSRQISAAVCAPCSEKSQKKPGATGHFQGTRMNPGNDIRYCSCCSNNARIFFEVSDLSVPPSFDST